ncbi:universal stress protein [Streptomyces sp. NPDC029080]|uniref:universal stress protein n=1 Tax=Streptomyces sp. NPDC029080 TaxID=3155017 RepID=UPI0033D03D7C
MRNTREDHHGRVIAGVDGHKDNVVTLRYAAEEARRRHAVLVAVTAWSPYGGDIAERTLPCPELDACQKASARTMLDITCARARLPEGLSLERRVEKGLLGPVLAQLARGTHDLLVIGPRHRQRLTCLHPSPDRYCLRNAAAPLLVIPSRWAATTGHPEPAT